MSGEKKKKWYEHFVTITDDKTGIADTTPSSKKPEANEKTESPTTPPSGLTQSHDDFVLTDNFTAIYEAAEIPTPAHGYTVYKIIELLESEDLRNMSADVRKSAILAALKITNVRIQDIIRDAAARDRTLDLYEKLKINAIGEFEKQKSAENAAIEKEIEDFIRQKKEQIETNQKAVEQAKTRLAEWQKLKQIEEKKIYDAVNPFIDDNPVTLS